VSRKPGFTLALFLLGVVACGEEMPGGDAIPIGLLLSYTGGLAGNSVNSERAVLLAIEAANASGGVNDRPLRLLARDTRSDAGKVDAPAKELLDAGSAILIGPDAGDFLTQLRPLLQDRTILLPSFATASDVEYKPAPWFLMGPSMARVACELMGQSAADGRRRLMQIVSPGSYNGSLSFVLTNTYKLYSTHRLSTDQASSTMSVGLLTREMLNADAYFLAASPSTAVSLVYALVAALGEIGDTTRWYLSPTLHTPAFLEAIPRGALEGARGVSPGTVAGAGGFREYFRARWQETPLDDAYSFFDAGALAALAIQHATRNGEPIPTGKGLSPHLVAVTRAGGTPIQWHEIGRGLELLRQGVEIEYFGLTGQLQFDDLGKPQNTTTKWWTIQDGRFVDLPHSTSCD
jgi:ABC-type branched-subunit amino acid transport system substrate-binding protein